MGRNIHSSCFRLRGDDLGDARDMLLEDALDAILLPSPSSDQTSATHALTDETIVANAYGSPDAA